MKSFLTRSKPGGESLPIITRKRKMAPIYWDSNLSSQVLKNKELRVKSQISFASR